jgi:hypothetical protein
MEFTNGAPQNDFTTGAPQNCIAPGDAWKGHWVSLIGRVVPAVPRVLGNPWTVWRPRRPCGSRPLDRVQKSPRALASCLTPGRSGFAVRGTSPLSPYVPLRPLGVLQGKAGPPRSALPRCPIDLGGPMCPMGPRGLTELCHAPTTMKSGYSPDAMTCRRVSRRSAWGVGGAEGSEGRNSSYQGHS